MRKSIFLLVLCMMIFTASSVVLASEDNKQLVNTDWVQQNEDAFKGALENPLASILGIITVIAGAIAVGMLIFIGIKYMTKGAGAKAEVKDTLLPYLIGAVVIGSASFLANAALTMFG